MANKEKLEKLTEKTKGELFFEGTRKRLIDKLLADNRYKTIQKSIKTKDKLINWQWIKIQILCVQTLSLCQSNFKRFKTEFNVKRSPKLHV